MESIAMLTFSLSGGGAQDVCRSWARNLAKRGHTVDVLVLDQRLGLITDEMMAPFRDLPVTITQVTASSFPGRLRWLVARLRSSPYTALLSLETYPNLLAVIARSLAKQNRTRVFISEHNIPSVILRAEGIRKRLQLTIAKSVYKRSDAVIAVSHAVATDLLCNFKLHSANVAVILNPIIFTNPEQANVYQPAPISVSLLVPARLVDQKRPSYALEIAEHLSQSVPSVTLTWVGDRRQGDEAKYRLTSSRVTVVMKHWSENWTDLAVNGTVVLLASEYEGLGNVLVEAAAAGIPVVAGSMALGCADAVVPGITGYLAECDSLESYSEAILKAVRMPKDVGPEGWLAEFSEEVCAEKIERLLGRARTTEAPVLAS